MLKHFNFLSLLAFLQLLPVCAWAESRFDLWLDQGYRHEDSSWTIADPSGSPNVLSDLRWEDLGIIQLRGRLDARLGDILFFRGMLGYGYVYLGENYDSDYDFDNREGEFSRSHNDASKGHTTDALFGVGMPFQLGRAEQRLEVIPMIGYSSHYQFLKMKNGVQVVTDTTLHPGWPAVGTRYPDLDSRYDMQWYGVWLGVDMHLSPAVNTQILIRLEHHSIRYYGEADWNLRTDWKHPRSFADEARGSGYVMRIGWNKTVFKNWKLGLELEYQSWKTEDGTRRVYFSNNSTLDTRFNGANRESFGLMFTTGCSCLEF